MGVLNVSASATDDSGIVSSVQVLLDGAPLGPAIVSGPYVAMLDTATVSAGAHILSATATDPSGNVGTSAAVSVTVSGELFDVTLVYDDGVAYDPGGTLSVSEALPSLPGAPTAWQSDLTAKVDASGRVLFRWPAAVGTVYVIVVSDAAGAVLWQTGTQLTPAQVPVQFTGVTATIKFSKLTGAWAGIASLLIAY
jgi:hypothetical protein